MNQSPDIETFVGDQSPNVTFTAYRGSVIVDLTGASVNFLLFDPNTKTQTNTGNEACMIINAAGGQFVYAWGTGDKPDAGVYRGYVQVTFPGAKPETAEVRVNVKPIGF